MRLAGLLSSCASVRFFNVDLVCWGLEEKGAGGGRGERLEVLHCNLAFSPLKERATLLAYTSVLAAAEVGSDEQFLRAGATPAWTKLHSLVQPTFLWILCDGVGSRNGRDAWVLLSWPPLWFASGRPALPGLYIVKLNALADIGRQNRAHRPQVWPIAELYAPNPIEN